MRFSGRRLNVGILLTESHPPTGALALAASSGAGGLPRGRIPQRSRRCSSRRRKRRLSARRLCRCHLSHARCAVSAAQSPPAFLVRLCQVSAHLAFCDSTVSIVSHGVPQALWHIRINTRCSGDNPAALFVRPASAVLSKTMTNIWRPLVSCPEG